MAYKIKSGDTLSQIAKRMGTTIKALMAANPKIKDPNKIRAGQSLNIPTKTSPGKETATIKVMGKDVEYQKKDGKYYRVKKDGTLAKNPASGLQAANLENPDSPLVTRKKSKGKTETDLPKSDSPYAGMTKSEMERMAMPKKRKKYTEEETKKMSTSEMEKALDEMFNMRKGGYAKKMNKGGYANCGASVAPAQKSTQKMMKGGYARKK